MADEIDWSSVAIDKLANEIHPALVQFTNEVQIS